MDWHIAVGTLGGVIAFASIIPYIRDILYGTTRPNVVSYILWFFLLSISITAQISAGASWSLIFLMGDLLAVIAVITLCLLGYGYKKYGRLEVACIALAFVAVISWQATNEPLYAIIFALIADLLAAAPTVAKAYHDPKSELPLGWFMVAVGGLLGIVSNEVFDLPNLVFPVYVVVINSMIGLLAIRKIKTLSF